jgi:hypothetical protein
MHPSPRAETTGPFLPNFLSFINSQTFLFFIQLNRSWKQVTHEPS